MHDHWTAGLITIWALGAMFGWCLRDLFTYANDSHDSNTKD